jgi:hypothetical protein
MRVSGLSGLAPEDIIESSKLTLIVSLGSTEQSLTAQYFHVIISGDLTLERRAESIQASSSALGSHITQIDRSVQAALGLDRMRMHQCTHMHGRIKR